MAGNLQQAAMRELARRELERRQSAPKEVSLSPFPDPRAAGLEAGLTMMTGGLSQIPAGLAGIGAGLIPGGMDGPQAVERVSSALTFQPRTRAGQALVEGLSKPFEAIEETADRIGEVSGEPTDTLGATAVKTALLGAPALLGLRAPRVPARAPRGAVPSVDDLKAAARDAYQRADNAGVVISRQSLDDFATRLMDRMANEGIDSNLHPDSMTALNRVLDSSGQNASLKHVDILRQIANDASSSARPADRRLASIIRDELDDYVENLGPTDTLGGDPISASLALKDARSLWSRARKGEEIERLITRAETRASQFSGSGFENALRTEFRQLAMNDKRLHRFSKAEQDAIRQVAKGGPTENALRMLGKLAPTGVISAAIGGSAGAIIGGPLGAAALPMLGGVARGAATSMTKRNATRAAEIARRGQ